LEGIAVWAAVFREKAEIKSSKQAVLKRYLECIMCDQGFLRNSMFIDAFWSNPEEATLVAAA